ncbi:sensor histidine kinase [Actinomadura parmotrematis]|uniref:histidine kinase n=1 Tax=Actinomadura parmotrematis TaxID=2864039 RepID=A0ABS7FX10_9ACTN|nr:sensor histidine kinase [Actinomadura parmotrematis]MBW8484970.1 sensor histidine kinase [Actinomadura parmotrematis]
MAGRAGGLWDAWRARRELVDAAFLAPVAVLMALEWPAATASGPAHVADPLPYLGLSLLLLAPLVVRRRRPRTVFAVVAVVAFGQWLSGTPLAIADVAVLIAMYTVASCCTRWWGLAALLVTEAGCALEAARQYPGDWTRARGPFLFLGVVAVGIGLFGVYMRTRREHLAALEERAARLERERDTEVRMARSAERARIARELHDVVAHNVSVIVVQADGAAFAIDTDPARAKQALAAISGTGRLALTEMRRLLGVLREADDSGPFAPQPGVEQLADLADQIRRAGLPVAVRVEGTPRELPEGLQLTVFRIVQEALTNALKHAGPDASAEVVLGYGGDAVAVRVADDGRGAAAVSDGRGHGLVGMRERAAVYGGEVTAGPRPGGGFEVAVRVPVPAGVRA